MSFERERLYQRNRKLGKLPPRLDDRTLKMKKYVSPATPPQAVYWSKGYRSWGMMLNDNLGDCTIAAVGHAIQTWKINLGKNVNLARVTLPDSAIELAYEQWCSYNPADPSTDQGGVELDVLNDWRQSGISGDKILAYADPDPASVLHVKQSIFLFGGSYIGFNVPQSAMDQNAAGQDWTVVPDDGGIAGGHAVWCPDYNPTGLWCITWGMRQFMTWEFFEKYTDESHALLSRDWLTSGNLDPTGVDLTTLQSDLQGVVS
jgi:hypothetical protein